jgi:Tol biopolymer transport system component
VRIVAASAALSVTAAAAWQLQRTPQRPSMVVPFTSFAGIESTPAFSPDGEHLAFSWDGPRRDNVDIYVKATSGDLVRITSNPAADQFPAFSPDGSVIAFVRDRRRVLVVPREGGPEREVGTVSDPRITFSPDGQFIAAGGPASPGAAGAGLVLIALADGAHRRLTAPPPGTSDIAPAFSPDGTRLAFQRIPTAAVSDIWVADATGANPTRITFDDRLLEGPVWTQDGRALIFASGRLGAGRLWRVPAAGGAPQALPDTGPGSSMPTVPRRGDRLAFVASLEDTNLWEVSIGPTGAATGPPRPGLSVSSWLDGSPDFSRDGSQLVFVSNRTGRDEIFVGSADSVAARQLTDFSRVPASAVGSPRFSPDGTRVAFDARVRGNADIYVVAAAGGTPERLTADPGADVVPNWSPDGEWIYFSSRRAGPPQVWRRRPGGGAEEQVTTEGAFGAQFSPDGRFLLYGRERVNTTLWRRPVQGGPEEPALVDDQGQPRLVAQFAFWRSTQDGVIFLERQPGISGSAPQFLLQSYDRASRRVRTILTLSAAPALAAGGLAVSPDGRRVLFTQVDQQRSDINLLQPYR